MLYKSSHYPKMNKFIHFENFRLAFKNVRANWLRTILTIFVIVFGIMSLVGMLTAVDGLKNSLLKNFSLIGSNTFTIQDRDFFATHEGKAIPFEKISYDQSRRFKEKYAFPSDISLHYTALHTAVVKFRSKKSNPKIRVIGTDANYMVTSALEVSDGRNFNSMEDQYGINVAIIGNTLATFLFKNESPLSKIITVGSAKFRVIGVLKAQGNSFGFSFDNTVIVPIQAARKSFPASSGSYTISVHVKSIEQIEPAIQEAIGIFRIIRKVRIADENNFNITKSDSLINIISSQLSVITLITLVISLVTLLSSAVGLMNIMLVSVKERIREIGTMKALGATVQNIKVQFISETLLISQIGGLIGIALGIAIGNFVSSFMGSSFVVPWGWIVIAYILSIIVGVTAGYYPAVKAAKLDPIEALRYE
jgi:putative ABC transport system permease protein